MRLGVVLFNLGGPDGPDAVRPFLTNLFSDPAIIALPGILRWPLARLIAGRRTPVAQEIYARMGGASPILPETQAQAAALDMALDRRGLEARSFIAMRYWKPFAAQAAAGRQGLGPGQDRAAAALSPILDHHDRLLAGRLGAGGAGCGLDGAERAGVLLSLAGGLCGARSPGCWARPCAACKPGLDYRVLFSAHGLPKRVVAGGDPYQWQVEQTAAGHCRGAGRAGAGAHHLLSEPGGAAGMDRTGHGR